MDPMLKCTNVLSQTFFVIFFNLPLFVFILLNIKVCEDVRNTLYIKRTPRKRMGDMFNKGDE